MERVRLDPHTLEIYLAEEPPQHSPLVVACAGCSKPCCSRQASAKQYAILRAADYSVTWAMNTELPPAVGTIDPLKVLPSQTS